MIVEFFITNLIVGALNLHTMALTPAENNTDLQERAVITYTSPKEALINALQSYNFEKRAKAINYSGEKHLQYTLPYLIEALNDPDYRIRGISAISLGKIKSQKAIPYLIKTLNDDHSSVRGSAALSLGRLKAKEASEPVTKLLTDSNPTVIVSAIYAIGVLEHKTAGNALIKLLYHDDAEVRENAAWVLGVLKLQESLYSLESLLQDPDERVRQSAQRAIFHIKYALLADISDIEFSGGEGTNIQDAIKITGIKNSLSCLRSQKAYIKQFYGENNDWEQVKQTHVKIDNKHYNLVVVKEIPSGKIRQFYFDITELFIK